MLKEEKFGQFTVYSSDISQSFVYANFDDPDSFMDGLSAYLLDEVNLLNYANTLTPIEFAANPIIYKRIYSELEIFLNDELELLSFDNVTNEIHTLLGQEYQFVNSDGETLIQTDKIGKIGEYAFHLLLTNYYGVHCIIPKFRCTTSRNMSVFGIDALFFDPAHQKMFFGESKVCKNIDNAISLVNRSFAEYEKQISEEYKLVLSKDEIFNLSDEFVNAFKKYTDVCISFSAFVKAAGINKICVPAFLAHGSDKSDNIENILERMNTKLTRNQFFGIETEYIFISLPIIDKARMMEKIMKKVVAKHHEYRDLLS